ncbi:kelch repeat-containing protein [Sorangium sp. So ce542]|uniref:kelch repeat-containing protein n=1 Tax=Sorangium sp. So ce542 TaxID=3133316 RepID=UPI003F63D531
MGPDEAPSWTIGWRCGLRSLASVARARRLAPVLIGLALLAGCAGSEVERGDPGGTRMAELPLATASMSVARANHTATRLLDGRILVAGGDASLLSGEYVSHASAEIYDPATGTWSAAASMGSRRVSHTATLLDDGRVLVTGGYDPAVHAAEDDPGVPTAEIYDPAVDAWTDAGSMVVPRAYHSAPRLADGRVLVVGGHGYYASLTFEIYDPATGAWSRVGSMQHGVFEERISTAIALQDGRVLAVGARHGSHHGAQVYDPASNAWSPTEPMTYERGVFATVMLLSTGKVLVLGNDDGGWTFRPPTEAEIYDPETNAWSSAPMNPRIPYHSDQGKGYGAALLPSGHVVLVGSLTVTERPCGDPDLGHCTLYDFWFDTETVIYDPVTGRSTTGPSLAVARSNSTVTALLDGKILVAGGYYATQGDYRFVATEHAELLTLGGLAGAPCGSAVDCASGSCADGVCCDAACEGACEACAVAAGGARDGVCSPLTGPACDDGDACTAADACQAGTCAGAPVGDGAPCDDGDACTAADACQSGACAGAPVGDGAPCDDGDACTLADTCQAGACAGAERVACAAPGACHLGVCDPASGRCVDALAPGGSACDDGDLCTRDRCHAGVCVAEPVSCTASDTCRIAACDEATGLCVESTKPDGASCDDGDFCTAPDTCQAGACTSTPKVCPVPSSCFSPGVCPGGCAPSLLPDGTPCPGPTTSAWTIGARLDPPRIGHAATLLQDGTVLVVGGAEFVADSPLVGLSSAARYDPASDTWRAVSPMQSRRLFPEATLLRDGTVLVIGGDDPPGAVGERYDPATDVWTPTGPMRPHDGARYATALLPDGKVFAGAGQFSTELYDPATNTWAPASPTRRPNTIIESATALPNGKILTLGGELAELYEPGTDTWSATGRWSPGGGEAVTLLPDGKVLVAGSRGSRGVLIYDPELDTWTYAARLLQEHTGHASVLLADGRVAVVGGSVISPSPWPFVAVEVYDPANDSWTFEPPPGVPVFGGSPATRLADGRVFVLGGPCPSGAGDCGFGHALLFTPGAASPGDGVCASGVCVMSAGNGAGGGGGDAAGGGTAATGGGDGGGGDGGGGDGGGGDGGGGTSTGTSAGSGGTSAGSGGTSAGSGGTGAGSGGTGGTSAGSGGANGASAGGGGTGGDHDASAGSSSTANVVSNSASAAASSSSAGGVSEPDDSACSTTPASKGSGITPWLLLAAVLGARAAQRRLGRDSDRAGRRLDV